MDLSAWVEILTARWTPPLIVMERGPASAAPLLKALSKFSLVYVWRIRNLSLRQYTWSRCSKGHLSLARLDRFYINSTFLNVVSNMNIIPSGFSDHHMVALRIHQPVRNRGAAYWTFNASLLDDQLFVDAFGVFWRALLQRKTSFPCLGKWWDNVKVQIRSFCQQYGAYHTKYDSALQSLLAKEILYLQTNLLASNHERTNLLLAKKKALLAGLCAKQARGALIRLRLENLCYLDTSSKFFFGLEAQTKRSQQITSFYKWTRK
uniref:Endonuclease/exonuclease/phosphatase domain-containing protein n=1 Tax=Eptatretus burgeri TaxID=7764 RepID=A0A8C4N2U4_EPTBU